MDINKKLRQLQKRDRRRKNRQRILRIMAMIVVFVTTYALILPAITLESPATCGLTEHTHGEQCYAPLDPTVCTLCEQPAHIHTDSCWEEVTEMVCEEHIHDNGCYALVTVCQQTEAAPHTHDDSCKMGDQLVCTLEETPGHSHGEDCVEKQLVCTLSESPDHIHDENCYFAERTLVCGMEETDECSHGQNSTEPVMELICELEAHTHTESCYPTPETETTVETAPAEGDPTADLETREQWEDGLTAAALTGDPGEDVIRIARTQLGYEESHRNYIYNEDNAICPYTRYGQWLGQPYGDWRGAFVSFCLHYGGAEGFEPTASVQSLQNTFQAKESYHDSGTYVPAPGDVVFLDQNADGNCEAAGIVEEILADDMLQLICGGISGRVDRMTIAVADAAIAGFGALPQEAEKTTEPPEETEGSSELPLVFEAEDGTQVQFIEESPVPLAAQLCVTEISPEEDTYQSMAQQIEDLLGEEPENIRLMDISFYDESGNYLPVEDTAQVVMDLDIGDADPAMIKVFHFVDGVPVELDTVTVNQMEIAVMSLRNQQTQPRIHTQLTFETEGFSVFAVVEMVGNGDQTEGNDLAFLAGKFFYIISNNENYLMTDSPGSGIGLYSSPYNTAADLEGKTSWEFLQVTGNTFRLRSSNGKYLQMEDSTFGDAYLYLVTEEANATVFTVRMINDQVEIGYDGPRGYAHYLNIMEGIGDFIGLENNADTNANSRLYLVQAKGEEEEAPDTGVNLDGKTFALLSSMNKRAIGTAGVTVNGVPGLKSLATQTVTDAGAVYYVGDVPLWTFEAAETEGAYHISTQSQGTKKYLRFLDTYYRGNANESKGSLTLGDTPQDIYVISNADGSIYLTVRDGENTGYVNLDQSGSNSFWVYNGEADSNKILLAQKLADSLLRYQLNLPSSSWINTPGIANSIQLLTGEPVQLYSVTGANAVGRFVVNSIGSRTDAVAYYNKYNTALGGNLTPENYKSPGTDYRFLGWSATVDGVSYRFAEGAAAVVQEDGIHITDIGGVERILPDGTVLNGRWEKISDVVLFFVNFGATMLETQDNKVISSYDSGYYTGVVAIAHIYNATTINPDKNAENKDVISKYKDALIQAEISPVYDPANTGTQIVIDAVAKINGTGTGFEFVGVSNYNQSQLENAVGLYLQNDPNTATQVKIDNAYVDKKEITADNYKLYWYLQKDVGSDGWHIDGALVAKTAPMEIIKTFSGLTGEEAESAIGKMSFPLSLIDTSGRKQSYTTLTASTSQPGVYTNDGKQSEGNIYKWTLQTIQGQRYAIEETGHLVDGHDWSGLVSVHFTDGNVEYHYNTNTTYGTTDLYQGKLEGGKVESVIFANFYTQTGTGAFSVSKVADDAGRIRLPGAKFTLTGVTNRQYKVTATTNENGAVHFADLAAGTYTLAETEAPVGYQHTDDTWTVTVTQTNGNATVQIRKNGSSGSAATVYDSSKGGIQQIYLIKNEPEDTTVTVNTYFSVISAAEVQELKDYAIEIRDSRGNVKSVLTLANASPITGSVNGYTWTINLDCNAEYTFTEKNFLHNNYLDTVVTAQHNNAALEPVKTDTDGDEIPDTAVMTVRKGEASDTVTITNTYTNTFRLKIRKVDATGNYAPMQGVEFNIYGSFGEATGSESLEYEDSNGVTHTVYLIGKTAPTDAAGITWYDNMKLSAGTRSFIYVVDEVVTPAGYVELDEPIVRMVEVDGENYSNGVYTLTVENHKRDLADVTVTATKQWNIPDNMDRPDVKLTLYRKSSDGSAVRLQEVILDGTDKAWTDEVSGITTTVTGWQVVWQGLTYAEDTTRYEYYVREEPLAAYHVSYTTALTTLQVGTEKVDAALADGSNLKRSVTIINSSGYALPDTGGRGLKSLYMPGIALMMFAAYMLWQTESGNGIAYIKTHIPFFRKKKK